MTFFPLHDLINQMVNHNQTQLDLSFSALAHPIRRGILMQLANGETTVAQLAKPHRVSAPAISKHLHILEDAGLMSRKKKGREYHCRLATDRMKQAEDWIERYRMFWEQSLDSLEIYLKEVQKKEKMRGDK